MWAIGRRVAPPMILILAALASVMYGARFHTVPVLTEQEVEVEVERWETPPMPPPPFFGPGSGGPGGASPFMPKLPPQKVIRTETQIEPVPVREPEYRVVLEATRGGVMRLADGQIKRTYSLVAGGAPPSGCPT